MLQQNADLAGRDLGLRLRKSAMSSDKVTPADFRNPVNNL
jgi:hypothetical protein